MHSSSSGPGEVQRLCEPSMVLGGQSPVTSAATTSPSNLGGHCVEGPVLVSSLAGDAVQLSTATSLHTEPRDQLIMSA